MLCFSKIPPSIIQHVMAGGQILGVSPQMMQELIQQYLNQMQRPTTLQQQPQAAVIPGFTYANGTLLPTLPTLNAIPKYVTQAVLNGGNLGNFDAGQVAAIKQHYLKEYLITAALPNEGPGSAKRAGHPPLVWKG